MKVKYQVNITQVADKLARPDGGGNKHAACWLGNAEPSAFRANTYLIVDGVQDLLDGSGMRFEDNLQPAGFGCGGVDAGLACPQSADAGCSSRRVPGCCCRIMDIRIVSMSRMNHPLPCLPAGSSAATPA